MVSVTLNDNVVEKVKQIIELNETKKNYIEELSTASRELERLAAWGGFNPDDFSYLAQVHFRFHHKSCTYL